MKLLTRMTSGPTAPAVRSLAVPASWDYEGWTDDLDRAVAALSHQDFAATARLLEHWLSRSRPGAWTTAACTSMPDPWSCSETPAVTRASASPGHPCRLTRRL